MTATNAPVPEAPDAPGASGGAAAPAPAPARSGTQAARRSRLPWRNPWGHPWFLEGFTWLYLIWSLVPIAIAVLFSFNNGRSQSTWQGFSWRWYFTDPVNSVLHNPQLHAAVIQTVRLSVLTTLIAVPLGVAFALGINRWRGPVPATFNFLMILSYVIPELIFGVSMFFVFTTLFSTVHLGTTAEVLGLVTWNVSWPAIVVQARLVTLGSHYEEAAADLGANQFQVIRRVLLPLLAPAIFASAVLVFSSVIDDFVIVDLLSSSAGNTPMSVVIYSTQHGGNGGPALNALGSIMLAMSLIIVIIGYVGYRVLTRGERGSSLAALTAISGEN
jgi:spermidine/putrescine transport system permease protein